jgi:hypothetical protein
MSLNFGKSSCICAARRLVDVFIFQMSDTPMMEICVLE